MGGLATGAAIGAVAGSILGINPVTGAALGGAAGVAKEARKGSGNQAVPRCRHTGHSATRLMLGGSFFDRQHPS